MSVFIYSPRLWIVFPVCILKIMKTLKKTPEIKSGLQKAFSGYVS